MNASRYCSTAEEGLCSNPAHLETERSSHHLSSPAVGLHSGAPVTLRLLPAPAGSRIGLLPTATSDNFEIPATGRYVARVSYATSLMRQGVHDSDTEICSSSLIGMGGKSGPTVIAELDNLAPLPHSGMAAPCLTVEAFLRVGIRTQRRRPRDHSCDEPQCEVREGNKSSVLSRPRLLALIHHSTFPRLWAIRCAPH